MRRSLTRRSQDNRPALRSALLDQLLDALEHKLDGGEDYRLITVDNLVSAAGVSKSKFYVYFMGMDDLLDAAFTRIVDELETIAHRWWELGPGITRTQLRTELSVILSAYRPRIPLLASAFDSTPFHSAVAKRAADLMNAVIAALREHIERGQRGKWIDPDVLAPETAGWIVWMAERGLSQMGRHADDSEFGQLVNACSDFIWNVLYARAPVRQER